MSAGRRRLVGVVLSALLLGLAGCVDVPTSGPVEKISGQEPPCENCVNVEVSPPVPGEDKATIVESYLRANANYQPNYAVAKQYLTRAAAAKWSPEGSVTIFADASKEPGQGNRITLRGKQVGYLDAFQTYNAQPLTLKKDFTLTREGGEWRIDTPPAGLFVSQSAFEELYKPYTLYFVGGAGSLVPQSIYLPNLRNPDSIATALVKALLKGPSDWLLPAVTSALPAGTALDVDAVTVVNGVAQVSLTDQVTGLDDLSRTQLAAQLVYTLQQVTGVKKVLVLVRNQPFRVLDSGSGDLAVPVDGISPGLDPIPSVPAEQLFAVRDGKLGTVSASTDDSDFSAVAGELGGGSRRIDSLGVSVTNSTVAVVTDGGTVLSQAASDGGKVTPLLRGVTRLLRPQYSRDDRLWAVADRGGRQQMLLVGPQSATPVTVEAMTKGRLLAFRISPDGSRMAMLITRRGTTTLGLGLIVGTGAATTVTGWRELDTRQTPTGSERRVPAALRDVAWTDASTLVVLRQDHYTHRFVPVELPDDASSILPEQPSNGWNARSLTVLLRTKTALVVTEDQRVLRDDGTSWLDYLRRVAAVAGPG
ncbi:LpqB family beta-propeller domain-containing protein [uncultured Friedmanniella sp.]|uniref:LpqB family beta-propeller domain-containing protein n=1 Tax=uncultured Friedmanniella sp. TaxID=335381 RepID=UPI0035C95A0A